MRSSRSGSCSADASSKAPDGSDSGSTWDSAGSTVAGRSVGLIIAGAPSVPKGLCAVVIFSGCPNQEIGGTFLEAAQIKK
jgi:hypothetical protein